MNKWIVGLAAAALVAGAAHAAETWSKYPYPALGFTVEFPAAPAVQTMQQPTPLGAIPVTVVAVDLGARGAVMVSHADYGAVAPNAQLDPAKALDGAVDGSAANIHATITSRQEISVEGHPAREFTARADAQGYLLKSRVVLVGKHLYQVLGVGPAASGVPAEYERTAASLSFSTR
jgi:hypothetical protein